MLMHVHVTSNIWLNLMLVHAQSTFTENSDYVGQSGVGITFFSGDVTGTNRCTSITINEDNIVEYNETFNVILTENSDRLVIQSGRNITQIIIMEDNDCKSFPIHTCSLPSKYIRRLHS